MAVVNSFRLSSSSYNPNTSSCCGSSCLDKFGCPSDRDPDFVIKRHDTKPPFKVSVEDCDGPLDLKGLVVEVNMWAKGRLSCCLEEDETYFKLAGDIGFEQAMIGDIIVMERVRMPEYMLVTGFDEYNKIIQVERGYRGTTPQRWKRGTNLRIFRVLNAAAESEMIFEDIQNVDGTVDKDVLTQSFLVYEWQPEDTCLPGCYWMEFKIVKMQGLVLYLPGGTWIGPTHVQSDGYYTGSITTDSSVRLSYDSANDRYLIPDTVWSGEYHLQSDQYFTGTVHNDGSVYLGRINIAADLDTMYDENGLVTLAALSCLSDISIIPSFIGSGLTPYYFCCILGEGVEWVRRVPTCEGEGFLIQIIDTPTSECIT